MPAAAAAAEQVDSGNLPAAGADADGVKRGGIGELVEKLLYLQIELKYVFRFVV